MIPTAICYPNGAAIGGHQFHPLYIGGRDLSDGGEGQVKGLMVMGYPNSKWTYFVSMLLTFSELRRLTGIWHFPMMAKVKISIEYLYV